MKLTTPEPLIVQMVFEEESMLRMTGVSRSLVELVTLYVGPPTVASDGAVELMLMSGVPMPTLMVAEVSVKKNVSSVAVIVCRPTAMNVTLAVSEPDVNAGSSLGVHPLVPSLLVRAAWLV